VTELPTGTVTFLFTDLEGSTRLWEEHPEAMRPALARHDEILREAIAANDGHVVKTTGDGIHAAFASAHDALGAAVRAQRVLGDESWAMPQPLKARMGLHTGEAEHRDGDYYGTATNGAARLMSIASDVETARGALEESLALVEGGAGSMSLPMTLSLLARVCVDRGETSRALELFAEAPANTRDQVNRPAQLTTIFRSVGIFAALGRDAAFATLVLFMSRIMATAVVSTLAKFERDEAQQLGELARTRLGDERFATANGRGASMTLAEAIDFVLAEVKDLQRELRHD